MTRKAWTSGGQAVKRRFAASDMPFLLWRERHVMLAVFGAVFLAGLIAALAMKASYTADVSILVRPGQEYVYEPWIGDAGRGSMLDPAAMVAAEGEILAARPLKLRLIEKLGLAGVAPGLAAHYARASTAEKPAIMAAAVRLVEQQLEIEAAGPILHARYNDRDATTAALVLNTLVDEYLAYRRTLLIEPGSPAVLAGQRELFAERLAEADTAVAEFYSAHGVTDIATEDAWLAEQQAGLEVQRREVGLRLRERSARLAALRAGAETFDGKIAALAAEVASLRKTQGAWEAEARRLAERRRQLASLAPEADLVTLAREVRRAGMRDFLVREERSWAAREIAAPSNVRILDRAVAPAGGGKRGMVIGLSLLAAAMVALAAGLLRVGLRPGLPTPQTAGATLNLPVLGSAGRKAQ